MQKRFLAISLMVCLIFGTIGQNPFASAKGSATAHVAYELSPDAEMPSGEEDASVGGAEGIAPDGGEAEGVEPGKEGAEPGVNEEGNLNPEQKQGGEEPEGKQTEKPDSDNPDADGQVLGTTITTSDGSTYAIEVTYPDDCGVPSEGTELLVSEIKPDEAGYDDYVAASMEQLGAEDERVLFARVFDITIADAKDHSIVYEPNGSVRVSIHLVGTDLDACAKVDVLHITEQKTRSTKSGAKAAPGHAYSIDKMDASKGGETVTFTTDGFSVYVIIGHEGGEVVTPRVEFHFAAPTEANASPVVQGGIAFYTTSPYVFQNKYGDHQTTMIVCDGDTLESIEAPMNTAEAYFYGWYTVNGDRATDTASYNPNTDTWNGTVTYSWPGETKRVELDKAVSVSATKDSNGAIQSITWSIEGVSDTISDTSMIDADGCAHVYLAPIYENYHFVNFHLGSYGETTATNIMARKLAVFGNDSTTSVRIGDITAPSTDPVHQIFVGWEYDINAHNENPAQFVTVSTIDMNGNEIVMPGKDGTYLDVTPDDVDLYPVFVQARWINFSLGASGNGALYVGPQFMYTSNYDDYPLEGKLPVPTRNGYDFDGWYLSEDGDKNGTGIKIAEADGSIVNGVNGAEFIYPDGSSLSNGTTEFRITADGHLYVYEALNELTLYAKWIIHHDDITYKVIIWKQKVTDDPNAADIDKTYDYYTYFLRDYDYAVAGDSFIVSVADSDKQYDVNNPNGDFTGFHYRTCDPATTVDPQGGTVLNVYYDRNKYTFTFKNYIYTTGAGNNATYGYLNGIYIQLSGSGNKYYYLSTTNNDNGQPVGADAEVYNAFSQRTTNPTYNTTYYSGTYSSGRLYWRQYNGTRYTRTPNRETIKTIEALSGQDISSQFPIVGSDGITYNHGERWSPQNSQTYDEVIVIINQVPEEDVEFWLDYAVRDTRTIYYYIQMLPGGTPDKTVNGIDYVLLGNPVNANVNFFTREDFVEIEGFTKNGSYPEFENNQINASSVEFYYSRNKEELAFAANYPQTLANEEPEAVVISGIYYQASLAQYSSQPGPAAPGNGEYYFDGWYEDASCTEEFDFANATMPAAKKIVYAKWSLVEYPIHIDPNGGVIDHIKYDDSSAAGLAATGLAYAGTSHYDNSKATYFDNIATQTIVQYENVERPYVEVSDAEAAQMNENEVYRYVYTYFSGREGGKGKLGADARNAVYILNTEASLQAYYEFYVAQVIARQARDPELQPLPRARWENVYVSATKYRELRSGEHYEFLGWYEIDVNGERAAMPFDFSQPADHETTLRAYWRLDGGYSLQYTTEYYAENGDYITGNLQNWVDPYDGGAAYTDGATTMAMQEPTAITVNAFESDAYQFRGWQIVKVETVAGRPRYTPLEPGVYYTAGQPLMVQAKYSDENMIIHMQAIYELRADAYRRPDVVNLTLMASPDGTLTESGNPDPAGDSSVDVSNGDMPTWTYPGHFYADEDGIYFGDVQSNTAVHLYKYATTLTASEITGDTLTPAGVNFFEHDMGYFLVGFDLDQPDDDFIPDYAADAVVAVTPGESHILHTVWEPMVYMTFKNDTGVGDVTINLSGTGRSMYIINQANGSFDRTLLDSSAPIVIPNGGQIKIVVPYGAGETITATGTNSLGTGYMLSAKSELGTTNPTARTLTGTLTGTEADYKKVANGESFGFSDQLLVDTEGVVITFTAEQAPHTLILKDNYNGDGTGGNTKEITFSKNGAGTVYYGTEDVVSFILPSTSTRLGYEFRGWATSYTATEANYSVNDGWTINSLTAFFDNGATEVKTLYGVWKANAEANIVYVWKEIDGPGNPNEEFTFTVSFSGEFDFQEYHPGWFLGGSWDSDDGVISSETAEGNAAILSGQFTLKHGEYLKVTSTQYLDDSTVNKPYLKVTVEKYGADKTLISTTELKWTWKYYNHENTDSTFRHKFIKFKNLNISVTESDYSTYYDLTETIAAETTNYPLSLDVPSRNVHWNDTFAGGTVIFTNTRKTADVTITKTLLPADIPAETFDYTVAFENGSDATHYEGYELTQTTHRITSGAAGWTIEDIPTGAILKITETVDSDLYETAASGTKNANGTAVADSDNADNVYTFTVMEDTTVNFTNTRKKQKVRLVVVDDGEPAEYLDSANFTWPGVFTGTKFSAEGTGLVYEGEVYVGRYTLTETDMPEHSGVRYIKLQSPVPVTIGGTIVSVPAGTENVSVSGPGADGYYTITVVNPKLMRVTVKKAIVNDYGSNSFLFTVTLTDAGGQPIKMTDVYGSDGTNAEGRLEFTLINKQSATLYIPRYSNLLIEETPDTWYDTVYQTGADIDDLGTETTGMDVTLSNVTDDQFILFTNTRKMIEVTVKKTVVGPGGDFTFAATVKNGNYVMTTFTDYGFTAGEQTFTLSPASNGTAQTVLTIPAGATLVLEETDPNTGTTRYNTSATGEVNDENHAAIGTYDNTNLSITLSADQTVLDLTVTFTNSEVTVAPTEADTRKLPYLWMLLAGILMVGAFIVFQRRKRFFEE